MIFRTFLLAFFGLLLSFSSPALAQLEDPATPVPFPQHRELTPEEKEQAAAACATCGGGMVVLAGIVVALIVLKILLLVWLARDAKNRGMDSVALWVMLVIFTNLIGLIIYLCVRQPGDLVECPHCRGRRLRVSARCPHCQNP